MATLEGDPFYDDPFSVSCRLHLVCPAPGQHEGLNAPVVERLGGGMKIHGPRPAPDPLPLTKHEAIREATRRKRGRALR